MERRAFLKSGLALAGGAASRLFLPSAATAAPALGNRLQAFADQIRGKVVTVGEQTYGMRSKLWNAEFDTVQPLAVVEVADEADIARSIAFARDEELDFVVRNGGHSFAGYSTSPGLIIDVRSLMSLKADPARGIATVGAGWTNLPLYEALWPHRMAVPAGTCPTVGITGLALGGGFGHLSRLRGLTSDNLIGVTTVTADGRIVAADENRNSDLLWASRGGGGGNFGVVTELSLRMYPVDMPFTDIQYTFAWSSALKLVQVWQDWITELPRESECVLELITGAPTAGGGPTATIDFVYAGRPERAEALARELVAAVGADPVTATKDTVSFVSAERDWSCAGLRPSECRPQGLAPDGKLPRTAIYIESDFVTEPWPDEGLELLIEAIERRQADRVLTPPDYDASDQVGKVLLETCGGAINDIAPDATAFPHRSALYIAQYQARWIPGADRSIADANIAWTRNMYESVKAYRSGASYVNYGAPDLADWQTAYYGANLPRLKQVKKKYDPENVFRFPQSIPPA